MRAQVALAGRMRSLFYLLFLVPQHVLSSLGERSRTILVANIFGVIKAISEIFAVR